MLFMVCRPCNAFPRHYCSAVDAGPRRADIELTLTSTGSTVYCVETLRALMLAERKCRTVSLDIARPGCFIAAVSRIS